MFRQSIIYFVIDYISMYTVIVSIYATYQVDNPLMSLNPENMRTLTRNDPTARITTLAENDGNTDQSSGGGAVLFSDPRDGFIPGML